MNTPRSSPLRLALIDLSGEATVSYSPLGVLYLRAALMEHSGLRDRVVVSTHPFLAGTATAAMATEIAASRPDLIGFSCQGWNITTYRQLLPTLRQMLPEGVIVLGGNHVTGQGNRWLNQTPEVDVVVNGEGERTICDLARWLLGDDIQLANIPGISYRADDRVVTTVDRPRASGMEEVPRAYTDPADLAGVDVALWETNRGCPYHCGFCHWGGAVGQKLSRATLDRLEQDLAIIGQSGVSTVFLCDANFGILPQDVDVARLIVKTRHRYGTPTTVHVNWAKNHADRVGQILRILADGDVHTNIYLALQTLSPTALALAGRDDHGRQKMMDLGKHLVEEGREVGVELIFGMPGETLPEFRAAYDRLFLAYPSLLLHPLWILPNTSYDARRAEFDLVTIRPDPTNDYEGVLSHSTLPVADNQAGLRLLLADEILIGSGYARATIRGICRWTTLPATAVLDSFTAFLEQRDDGLSRHLAEAFEEITIECYFHRHLRGRIRAALFADRDRSAAMLAEFIDTLTAEPAVHTACRELVRYDTAQLPRADLDGTGVAEEDLLCAFNAHALDRALLSRTPPLPQRAPTLIRLRHEAGFARHTGDAIDFSARWRGRVIDVTTLASV